jgi:hypothetical protein
MILNSAKLQHLAPRKAAWLLARGRLGSQKCTRPNKLGNALGQDIGGALRPSENQSQAETNRLARYEAEASSRANGKAFNTAFNQYLTGDLGRDISYPTKDDTSYLGNLGFDGRSGGIYPKYGQNTPADLGYPHSTPESIVQSVSKSYTTVQDTYNDIGDLSKRTVTYHPEFEGTINNASERLSTKLEDALLNPPDFVKANPFLSYAYDSTKAYRQAVNFVGNAILSAPRIVTDGNYLPDLLTRANSTLAASKAYAQGKIVQAGSFGLKLGGPIGDQIYAGAAVAYVGAEILLPTNVVEAGLFFAGPAIGKLGGAGVNALKGLPILGADVGVLSKATGRYLTAGAAEQYLKLSARYPNLVASPYMAARSGLEADLALGVRAAANEPLGTIGNGLIAPGSATRSVFNSFPTTTNLQLSGLAEQAQFLAAHVPELGTNQATLILEGAFGRESSAVFGGSRIRGDFKSGGFLDGSDIDVGFGELNANQAGKLIDKLNKQFSLDPTQLRLERTRITPGNTTPTITSPIISPEEFFQRSGLRVLPDPRAGEYYIPSGSITVRPDGSITITPPGAF